MLVVKLQLVRGAGHTPLLSPAGARRAEGREVPPPALQAPPSAEGRVAGCSSGDVGSWGRSQRLGPQERAGRGPGFPGGASCLRNEESWEQVMKPQPGLREAACPAGLAPTCLSLLLSLLALGCGSLCSPVAHRGEQAGGWTWPGTQHPEVQIWLLGRKDKLKVPGWEECF